MAFVFSHIETRKAITHKVHKNDYECSTQISASCFKRVARLIQKVRGLLTLSCDQLHAELHNKFRLVHKNRFTFRHSFGSSSRIFSIKSHAIVILVSNDCFFFFLHSIQLDLMRLKGIQTTFARNVYYIVHTAHIV